MRARLTRSLALAIYVVTATLTSVWAQRLPSGESPHGTGPPEFGMPALPSVQAITTADARTVYAGSFGKGVFRSDDRGDNWTPVNAGMTDRFILSLAAGSNDTVYAGTFRGGVFESRNGGRSWQPINQGLKRLEIKALLIHGGVLYAGTSDGLYQRALDGTEWSVVTKGLDDTLVHSVAVGSDRALYVGTSGRGIFRYDRNPQGPGWTRLSHGLVDHEGLVENFIRVVAVDKDGIYVGTFDGGVFASRDAGTTWRPISRALPNDSIRGILTNDKGLFVATGRGIFRSEDHGRKWVPVNKGLIELSVQVLVASNEGALYAGTSSGVFRSDDDGKSWVGLGNGM